MCNTQTLDHVLFLNVLAACKMSRTALYIYRTNVLFVLVNLPKDRLGGGINAKHSVVEFIHKLIADANRPTTANQTSLYFQIEFAAFNRSLSVLSR